MVELSAKHGGNVSKNKGLEKHWAFLSKDTNKQKKLMKK